MLFYIFFAFARTRPGYKSIEAKENKNVKNSLNKVLGGKIMLQQVIAECHINLYQVQCSRCRSCRCLSLCFNLILI